MSPLLLLISATLGALGSDQGCTLSTCKNGGTCVLKPDGVTPYCYCPQAFQGEYCEKLHLEVKSCKAINRNNYGLKSGVVTSPGFPSDYPNTQRCAYFFGTPDAKKVELTIHALGFEPNKDDIRIGTGAFADVNQEFLYRYDGVDYNPLPGPLTLNGDRAWLNFYSDFNIVFGGFNISWRIDGDECIGDPCAEDEVCVDGEYTYTCNAASVEAARITDIEDVISDFLQYIPGVGTLYQAPREFVSSLRDNSEGIPAGLSIINGASRDFFHYSSLVEPDDSVVVHSVFDNEATNALGRLLDLMGRNAARERVMAAVRRHLRNVNAMSLEFLLVHHIEENDEFHRRFLDNRVRIAKYGLTTGATYLGLLSYEDYARDSLIVFNVPNGFKKGNPIRISWKFDRLWIGTLNHITKSTGIIGKCEINGTDPGQESVEIEVLRDETYYWFKGTIYLGDIERGEGVKAYELVDSSIALTMHSLNPNASLGTITRLEMQGDENV